MDAGGCASPEEALTAEAGSALGNFIQGMLAPPLQSKEGSDVTALPDLPTWPHSTVGSFTPVS